LKSYPKKLIHSSYTKQYLFLKNSICNSSKKGE